MTIRELINELEELIRNKEVIDTTEVGVEIYSEISGYTTVADLDVVLVVGDYAGTAEDGIRLLGTEFLAAYDLKRYNLECSLKELS
jgi:hypothetical protein